MTTQKASKLNINSIAKIAILSAVSILLMMISFPLPVAPSFYKLDLSEVAVVIGGFAMGPLAAVLIELCKIVLNFLYNGTITAGIGEAANFLIGCALVVPASIIYRKDPNSKSALKGLIVGTLTMVVVSDLLNYFVLLPAYVSIVHFPMEAILAAVPDMMKPLVNSQFTLVLYCVTLFNLIKGICISIVTMLIEPHLDKLLRENH